MGRPILSARFLSTYQANNGCPYPFPPADQASPSVKRTPCPPAPLVQPTLLPSPPQLAEERVYKWSEKPFDPDADPAEGYVWEAFLPPRPGTAVPKPDPEPDHPPLNAREEAEQGEDAHDLLREISASPPHVPSEAQVETDGEELAMDGEEEDEDDLALDLTLDLSDDEESEDDELAGVDVLELARRAEAFVRAQQEEG